MKAKLLLDSKDFDKNIKKSKKNASDFGKAGQQMSKEVTSQFKKLVSAVLATNLASDAFKAFVNSSQAIGDQFRANVEGMKTVVDNFVYSLANADFSPFSQGLSKMFDKAKEAAGAADQFGNTQMATSFVSAMQGSAYREAMSKARNKSLSADERKYWMEQARLEAEAIREAQKTLERDALEKLKTEIAAQTGLGKYFVGEKAILDAISLDARYNNKTERAAIEEAYNKLIAENKARTEEVMKQYTTTTTNYGSSLTGGMSYTTTRLAGYEEAMAAAEEKNQQRLRANADLIVKYNLLFRKSDEALKEVYATAQSAVAARNQLAEIATSTNEVENSLNTEMEKAAAATDEATRKIVEMKNEYAALAAYVKANPIDTSITPMTSSTFGAIQTGAQMKEELMPAKNFLTGRSRIEAIDADALTQQLIDNDFMKNMDERTKSLENMNEVVGMLGSSFSQLGSSIGGTAGNMLTFIGTILDAVQAIIPFISYLYAESAAHNANTSAAAAEGASKAMSAYAGIPFAGIPLGLAAVAAIIAAVQSVPKFAEGGIVTSATLGVFGEAGPEAVMPLDKLEEFVSPRDLRVTGNIKASGKDLVVVIDNYNRVRNG